MVETIEHNGEILVIIIGHDHHSPGINFVTPDSFSQQLAYMSHPAGKNIEPHVHNYCPRQVFINQEVLVIRKGKLRMDLYSGERQYLESRVLTAGDVVLLASGGHGFHVIEDVEMIEAKLGPFIGDKDKTRFKPSDLPSDLIAAPVVLKKEQA
jgi:hypothetical protein